MAAAAASDTDTEIQQKKLENKQKNPHDCHHD
jgi:hypothetical protein